MHRSTTIVILLAVLLLPAPELMAKHHGKHGKKGMLIHNVQHLKEKLDLNAKQVADIKAINKRHKGVYKQSLSVLEPSRERIHQLTLSYPINYDAIRQIMRDNADTHIELRIAHIKHREAVRDILRPKQKKQFDELVKKHKKFRRDKKKRLLN